MAHASRPQRAAQYLRMSTEHQQYSTANQRDAIAAYASVRGIEIVATYEDAGKSGLTLAGRPLLRKLIADVVGGQNLFDMILVYDVSRWGRFQDADESAHLEYLCRMAGVHVEYCAEPFSNDGTPFSNICKVVKRALAAEYSRELSEKVYSGKRRLIKLGYRQGGGAGYGLRRCLVDETGKRKQVLARGERKSITTDRVILVPGPPEVVAVVRRIFRDYTKRKLGTRAITDRLNREGILNAYGRPWGHAVVKRLLTDEKYVGNSVWGRVACKLRAKQRCNPSEKWVRYDGAFEGIVSPKVFQAAQELRAERARHLTDDEIISLCQAIHRKHGKITTSLINKGDRIKADGIRERFGSLVIAYERAGYFQKRDLDFLALNRSARSLRTSTAQTIVRGVEKAGGTVDRLPGHCRFLINGEVSITIAVARQQQTQRRSPHWYVKQGGSDDDLTIAVLMDGPFERAKAYYVFPSSELRNGRWLSLRNSANIEAFRLAGLEVLFPLFERAFPRIDCVHVPRRRDDFEVQPFKAIPKLLTSAKGRHFRSTTGKSYTAAFLRASQKMRTAIAAARKSQTSLERIRGNLAELVAHSSFVRLLATKGIKSVPTSLYRQESAIRNEELIFLSKLRKRANSLLSTTEMAPRAKSMLDRVIQTRRISAAECMVLASDHTESFALALVAATRPSALIARPRPHVYGAKEEELKAFIEEAEYLYPIAKRTLSGFGPRALDLVTLTAFARRLLRDADIVEWLRRQDARTLRELRLLN